MKLFLKTVGLFGFCMGLVFTMACGGGDDEGPTPQQVGNTASQIANTVSSLMTSTTTN